MPTKRERNIYIFILSLLSIFLVLKMLRGFTESEEQGGVWNIIQGLFVVFGVAVLIGGKDRSFKQYSCIRLYVTFMLYIWFLSMFPFLYSKMQISNVFGFLTVPYGVMVLLLFYQIASHVKIEDHRLFLVITFYVIAFICFNALRSFRMYISDNQGAIADVYYVVGLLPLMFVYTSKKFSVIPFIVACIIVMMSDKRAGFLALAVIMVIYFLLGSTEKKKRGLLIKRIFIFSIVVAATFYVITNLVSQFGLNMFDRLGKMEEDGGSGRADRWNLVWNSLWNYSNFLQLLFGHGAGATWRLIGGHAHNDFLEFFFDYGFLAVLMYVFFFVALFREGLKMYRHKYHYAREFMCSFVVALFLASFSFYAIDCTHITCSSVCLGLLLADWNKFKQNGYARITE